MHLDSPDKQAISRGNSGFDPCKTLLRPQKEAASKYLLRMQVCRSVTLVVQSRKFQFCQLLAPACLMDGICVVCVQLTCMWACVKGMRDS